ncbi:glycerophosphodiester phosphodiesterase [Pleomorphochaeta sp. DL1XJH-081]|uniref:glycerophosphodiester phosphodiesterase n=1 Tax=Pleomorphochaeta sp. DL1XJH-081 TaxID=3409690 RepID=UPI003BB7E66B
MDTMKVYAHRGFSGRYPENTMVAFEKAAEAGCDGIELDVQLTRDGQLVVIHDETVDRTTDGSGLVSAYSMAELGKLNASSPLPAYTAITRIPSFEEYCAWAASTAGVVTNVELKSSVIYYPDLERKALDMVIRYGLEGRVFFSSFNHLSILEIKRMAPHIPCGALVEQQGLKYAGYYCEKFGFDYFHPGRPSVTKESVAECHAHGIAVNVWTVNTVDDYRMMEAIGVDGVFTNYPGKNSTSPR